MIGVSFIIIMTGVLLIIRLSSPMCVFPKVSQLMREGVYGTSRYNMEILQPIGNILSSIFFVFKARIIFYERNGNLPRQAIDCLIH